MNFLHLVLIIVFVALGIAVSILLASILNLFLSAIGNIVFGLLSSYSFVAFQFLFFSIQKTTDGLKTKFQKIALNQTGCIMEPAASFENFKFKAFSLGGIFLNLLISFLLYVPMFYYIENIYIKSMILVFFIYNVLAALFNMRPRKDDFTHLTLIQALEDNEEIRSAYYYYLKINAELYKGYTLKEMAPELFAQEYSIDKTNPYRDSYIMLKSNKLFSENKNEEALKLMDKVFKGKETVNSLARKFYYYIQVDKKKAKEIFEKEEMQNFLKLDNALAKRYLAAYNLFVLNDKEKGISYADESRRLQEKINVYGLKRMEDESLNEILESFDS